MDLLVRPDGFEPPTNWFEASYSIQLSYGRAVVRWSYKSPCTRKDNLAQRAANHIASTGV